MAAAVGIRAYLRAEDGWYERGIKYEEPIKA